MNRKHVWAWLALSALTASPACLALDRNPTPAHREQDFTLEQLLDAPFPNPAVAAGAKGRFAWIQEDRGRRSIWVAEPAAAGSGYTSRRLVEFAADDGIEVAELAFTPDANALLFVKGGDFAFPGAPVPNPASLTSGVDQAIWMIRLQDGASAKIGAGHSPAVSPRGDLVAYLNGGQIWLQPLASTLPARHLSARGTSSSLRWDPTGSRLAFVSARDDHSFIGLYSLGTEQIRYLDPHTSFDQEPVWSPNGESIAFVRVPWTKPTIGGPRRTGVPWSIEVAAVASGETRELWRAPEGFGSVYIQQPFSRDHLFWAANNRIIFYSELDGWWHLYSVASSGGRAENLTPGEFEVEWVDLSPDRRTLVYSSNRNDLDRRHIWMQNVAGGEPTALTSGSGIENAPVMGDGPHGRVVFLRSDATHPLRPAIISDQGKPIDLAPQTLPAHYPSAALVVPQAVMIRAADGVQSHGQLLIPRDSDPTARHPAVIFLHGLPERQMLLGFHYVEYYQWAYAVNEFLASRGYVVLTINYRCGTGYGIDFREAVASGVTGASEFADVLAAGRYLQQRPDVDPARIGLWGKSYGGYLTALALARASDVFAAGVSSSGVYDQYHARFVGRGLAAAFPPDFSPSDFETAWSSSPLASIDTWRSPVLVIHSDDDRNVPFSEAVRVTAALQAHHIPFEELIIPDEVHGFETFGHRVAEVSATVEFFERHLAAAPHASAPRSAARTP